jgi:hypothetical protein
VLGVIALAVIACYAGYAYLSPLCRRIELGLASAMLGNPAWVRPLSVTRSARRAGQTVRVPFSTSATRLAIGSGHGFVVVAFTTYSSSLIALLAVGCCGLLIVKAPRLRRYAAVAISVAAVVVWSSLRLIGSFWLIRLFGGSVRWLFDDWFGIMLVLVDTALGYHLLIWLLLPAKRQQA